MLIEWLSVLAVLALGAWIVHRSARGMPRAGWALLALVAGGLVFGLSLRRTSLAASDAHRGYLTDALPRERSDHDYIGSNSCRACHADEHASWHRTYHRTMTQPATPENVKGDFDNATMRHNDRVYRFEREGDRFFVDMVDPEWEARRFGGARPDVLGVPDAPRVRARVVMITGSHRMQVYWVAGSTPNHLHYVAAVYLFEEQRWVPRDDVFMQPPDTQQRILIWNDSCIICHSTAGQSKVPDYVNPSDTRAAELGIACEACHGPGREHVERYRDPLARMRDAGDEDAELKIVNPAKLPHDRSSHVCGQCHTVAVLRTDERNHEGFAYRPGDDLLDSRVLMIPGRPRAQPIIDSLLRNDPGWAKALYWDDGEVRVSGRDFTGLAVSPCYERGEISCLSCHTMHAGDPNDQLIPSKMGDESCLQCHGEYRDDPSAHTHHAAGSTGSECLNCHMPHTNYGLLGAIRTHAISSPSLQASVDTGRPNACNLCHLDQSHEWTAEHLTEWYEQPAVDLPDDLRSVAAGPLWTLKGEAGVRALAAWSFGWGPAKEASGTDWMAPYLGQLLVDDYAAVRFVAKRSLLAMPDYSGLEYDYVGAETHWNEVRQVVDRVWAENAPSRDANAHLLLDESGRLQRERVEELLRNRDTSRVVLHE